MTIQTLRPTSTGTTVAITSTSGAGAVHTDLSDNNDTTLTRGTANLGYCYLGLADATVSGSQRVKQVKVRVKRARDAADVGAIEQFRVRLFDPVTHQFAKGDTFNVYYSTQSIAEGGWVKTDPGGAAWTDTVVDRLNAEITWYTSTGGLWARVSELYVDADVNSQPVVTAPTVTGATSTTTPSATTTWTDADGDVQTRIQWKVYSAAQYGATNFSPDTSPATWDSGQLQTADVTTTIGTALVNGVTYRLYVRGAQSWSGPAGTLWWSDWQFTGFTIALVPPAAPTLTASTVATAPGSRVLLDVTAPVNLLTADNSTFESSIGQWVSLANCTVSVSATNPGEGAQSMQMSSTAGGDMTARSGNEPFLGQHVKGGGTYTVLASFRAAVSGRSCAVGVRWQDAANAVIGADVYGSIVTDTTVGYTQAFYTGTAPGNAKTAQVLVKVAATGGAAEIHRVDKTDLHVGTSTVWTPGGMASQVVAIERGERVDTSRGERANWAHPDVATAGSIRTTTGYGFWVTASGDTIPWEHLDKDIPGAPSGMLHWMPRSATAASVVIGGWPYGGPDEAEWQFPVLCGSGHVLSFWAWVASSTLALTPKIDWMSDAGVVVSTTTGGAVTLTTTPQQVSLTGTAPATASGARGLLTNHLANAAADIYLTRVGWGLGTVAVDDKPAAGGPVVWTPVRGTSDVQPFGLPFALDQGQHLVISDFEAPPGRPLLYRAQLSGTLGGTGMASPYSAYATVLLPTVTKAVIRDPLSPTGSTAGNIDVGDTAERGSDGAVVHLLGRDADPVTVTTWRSGLDTTLAMVATTDGDYQRLTGILDVTNSLLVQWAEGGQTYYRVTGWRGRRLTYGKYELAVAVIETAAP